MKEREREKEKERSYLELESIVLSEYEDENFVIVKSERQRKLEIDSLNKNIKNRIKTTNFKLK